MQGVYTHSTNTSSWGNLTLNNSGLNSRSSSELTNHLGNVLSTISDRKIWNSTDSHYEAVVTMYADYYAFGMMMPNRHGGELGRYLFNGMEHDGEVSGNGNSYTTEFRQYDPRLGRWKSLDPLMKIFPQLSPYVGFDNNPIYYIDPYGLSSEKGDGGGEPEKDDRKHYTGDKDPGKRSLFKVDGKYHSVKKGDIYTNKETGEVSEYQGRKEGGWKTIEGKIQEFSDEVVITGQDKSEGVKYHEQGKYFSNDLGETWSYAYNSYTGVYRKEYFDLFIKDIEPRVIGGAGIAEDLIGGGIVKSGVKLIPLIVKGGKNAAKKEGVKQSVKISKKAQDIYNSISTKIRGQNGYVDLSKFVDGKHAKSGYSLSKTQGNTHGKDAIWKLLDSKGNRVATLDSTGKILRK